MPAPRLVGSAVKRLEDPRLIRGQAQYVDDLTVPGTLLRIRHLDMPLRPKKIWRAIRESRTAPEGA